MTCRGPYCNRPVYAHGLCETHRRQERRGRPLTPIRIYRYDARVRVEGRCKCGRPAHVRGLCRRCYLAELRARVDRGSVSAFALVAEAFRVYWECEGGELDFARAKKRAEMALYRYADRLAKGRGVVARAA